MVDYVSLRCGIGSNFGIDKAKFIKIKKRLAISAFGEILGGAPAQEFWRSITLAFSSW